MFVRRGEVVRVVVVRGVVVVTCGRARVADGYAAPRLECVSSEERRALVTRRFDALRRPTLADARPCRDLYLQIAMLCLGYNLQKRSPRRVSRFANRYKRVCRRFGTLGTHGSGNA